VKIVQSTERKIGGNGILIGQSPDAPSAFGNKMTKKMIIIFFSLFSAAIAVQSFAEQAIIRLNQNQIDQTILYGNFTGDAYVGKIFNQNQDISISQITIEAIPKDEKNPFNRFSPRIFNVNVNCIPRAMSSEFTFETGALNPEFHTPKIVESKGYLAE